MDKSFKYMKPADKAFEIAILIVGVLVLLCVIYPLYYVIIASISNPSLVMTGGVWLYPRALTLDGFEALLGESKVWIGYRNTIFYSIAATALSMLVTIPAAYSLSRKDFKARRPLMLFFLFTMYFSGGLIPTYLLISNTLHMTDTVWVMIIPFCLNVYNMIIVRSYFENSLPADLWEAAQLDGCSNTRFLITIALPLSMAVISVVMLYYLVANWNAYFNGLIYLRDEELVPLQLVLRDILLMNEMMANSLSTGGSMGLDGAMKRAYQIKFTSIIVGTLPMMILYPFLQKYFEKGVMIGAIKG